jgi:hypothetical protein
MNRHFFKRFWRILSCAGIIFMLPFGLLAQSLPQSQIFLFDWVHYASDSALSNPRFLTAFNPDGYNNQPWFSSEEVLWITSDYSQKGVPGLWRMRMKDQVLEQKWAAYPRAYSPGPSGQKEIMRFLWVADTVKPAQRIYQGNPDSSLKPTPLFGELDQIGYYTWYNRDSAVLFLLGPPFQLSMVAVKDGGKQLIALNVGRSFHFNGAGLLLYVQKLTESTWYLKSYDPISRRHSILVKTLGGAEDFCIMPDGRILMGQGSMLYQYREGKSVGWELVQDLKVFGLTNINRITVSPGGQLAIVNIKS